MYLVAQQEFISFTATQLSKLGLNKLTHSICAQLKLEILGFRKLKIIFKLIN